MDDEATVMAKKKATKPKVDKSPKAEKPREEWNRKPLVLQMRGSEEWKAWVEALADKEGDTTAKLVERALRDYARRNQYPDPPKR